MFRAQAIQDSSPSSHVRSASWAGAIPPLLPLIVGALLLLAGTLKAHHLATEPVAELLHLPRWTLAAAVAFELLLGLWLLSGVRPWHARALALLSFVCFLMLALYQALQGSDSCGCLGKVPLPPWGAVLLDGTAILALYYWRPLPEPSAHVARRLRPWFVVAALLLLTVPLGALSLATSTPASLRSDGEIIGSTPFVVLEPTTWLGKRLPLLPYIDIGDQLAQGEWIVLLHHTTCPLCRDIVSSYAQRASTPEGPGQGCKIAVIELPPYGPATESPASPTAWCSGRLSSEHEWFVELPVELHLTQGILSAVHLRPALEQRRRQSVRNPSAHGDTRPLQVPSHSIRASVFTRSDP